MSRKSAWKTTSVQDCGCQNQQRHAYSTIPIETGSAVLKMRIKPCAEHAPLFESNEDCSFTYEEFWNLW